MSGSGFMSQPGARRQAALASQAALAPVLAPGASWTGVAGSGFANIPTDPARTTAKPAVRLIVPPNQYYTKELLIGVYAGANNQGTLGPDMGLSALVVHCEGASATVPRPSFQTFKDANGNPVTYFGWWATLRHDGRNGHAQVYFEAVPADPTMQRRVMGPYQFSPQAAMHDYSVTVAPSQASIAGSRYTSITSALAYLAGANANNPLITITEGGTYDLALLSSVYQGQGYCTITASVPVTFGKSAFTTESAALIRSRYDGLHFRGANITFDARFVSAVYHENATGRQHWLDGVNIINSAGRYSLWRSGSRPLAFFVRNAPWFTECTFNAISNACLGANLARGCRMSLGYIDALTDVCCAIGNTIDDWDASDGYCIDVPAFTVSYAGTEAAATLELSGGNDSSSRTFTARWGANSATFTVGNTEALYTQNTNYRVSHVVNWLNGLNVGFTATLLDDTRRASACSLSGAKGAAFAATSVKNATLTIVTMLDLHSDWFQQNNAGLLENGIAADNLCTNMVSQNIFVTGTAGAKDFLFLNNAFYNKTLSGPYNNYQYLQSQLNYLHSHVVLAHNSMATQGLWIRTDTNYQSDGYCLVANNALMHLLWTSAANTTLKIRYNYLASGATLPANSVGTIIGGTQEQSFASSQEGLFAPRGTLRTIAVTPCMTYDRKGRRRDYIDSPGSDAIERD